MGKLFRVEVARLLHNKAFLGMVAALAIFSLAYGYMGYQRAYLSFYGQSHMTGMVFLNAMGDLFFPPFLSMLAAVCMIGGDFAGKNVNTSLYACSRFQVYFVKSVLYFACVLGLSILAPLFAFLFYELPHFSLDSLPLDYMLRCICQRAVCDLTIAVVPLFFAFLLRDYIKTGAAGLLYAFWLYQLGQNPGIPSTASPLAFVYTHLPPAAAPYIMQKLPQPNPDWIPHTMLLCAGVFVVFWVAGYLAFRKANLK